MALWVSSAVHSHFGVILIKWPEYTAYSITVIALRYSFPRPLFLGMNSEEQQDRLVIYLRNFKCESKFLISYQDSFLFKNMVGAKNKEITSAATKIVSSGKIL